MADSFAADLVVACHLCRKRVPRPASSWGLSTSHQFAPLVAVVCSMCKNSSIARGSDTGKQARQRRSRYQGREKLWLLQNRLGMT